MSIQCLHFPNLEGERIKARGQAGRQALRRADGIEDEEGREKQKKKDWGSEIGLCKRHE